MLEYLLHPCFHKLYKSSTMFILDEFYNLGYGEILKCDEEIIHMRSCYQLNANFNQLNYYEKTLRLHVHYKP